MIFPTLSPKERFALRMLISNDEMYGLEMVKSSGGELKRGTVYTTLFRMADKGYVESRQLKEDGERGLPKRMFRATKYGKSVIDAWELAGATLSAEISA